MASSFQLLQALLPFTFDHTTSCITLLFATVILLIATNLYLKRIKRKLITLPPGPPRWPLVGNLLQVGPQPHRGFHRLHHKYGPILYLKLGSLNCLATNDPDIIRELLVTQDDVFASRAKTITTEYFCYDNRDLAFAPYGPHWKAMRRICLEHLLTPKRLQSFRLQRVEEAQFMVHEIWKKAQEGREIQLKQFFSAFTMNCITGMLFRKRYHTGELGNGDESSNYSNTLREIFHMMGVVDVGDYFPALRWLDLQGQEKRIKEVYKKMEEFHNQILEEHVKQQGQKHEIPNFIDVMLSLKEERSQFLSDTEIKALAQDMLAAGTDTSTVTSEWAMTEVLRNRQILQKAQEELDSVVGKERMVEESDLSQLPYLKWIVMETLRLRPPGTFLIPRYSLRDTKVAGYHVPAETHILINLYSLGRNPKVWGEDPRLPLEEFHPERHKDDPTRIEVSAGAELKHLAFGGGKRRCPGAALGITFVMWMVARLLHSFDWKPSETIDDVSEMFGLTVPRATPLMAIPKPRLPPHLYKYV